MKPSPPPPPPSPPRRSSFGFGARRGAAAEALRVTDELEVPTASGYGEPSTLGRNDRAPETVPVDTTPDARPGPSNQALALSFDDETQARPVDDHVLDKFLHEKAQADLGVDYESLPSLEVRRPYDTYEAEFSERDPVTQLHGAHALESAAQLRDAGRRDEQDSERYPVVAPVATRREESGPRERPSPPGALPGARAYAAAVPSYDDASDPAQWGRDSAEPAQHARAEEIFYEQPVIPPAARVPEEMRPAFVVGVQPIRTPTPDAWRTPRAHNTPAPHFPAPQQAAHPAHAGPPAAYAQQQAQRQYVQQQAQQQQYVQQQPQGYHLSSHPYAPPVRMTPYPGAPYPGHHVLAPMHGGGGHMSSMAPSMAERSQPVGAQLVEQGAPSNKIGRMTWFAAGAAFGVAFAVFATGFFSGGKSDEFPAAPALPGMAATAAATAPAATAPAATAPVAPPAVSPAVAPAVAPLVAPPVASFFASPSALPPAAAPPQVGVAPAAPSPAAAARAPAHAAHVAPRAHAPRRPSAPPPPAAPAAPRSPGGNAAASDDDAPASRSVPASAPSSDITDLLGAGLKP